MKPPLGTLFGLFGLIFAAHTALGQTHTQSISFDDGVGTGNVGIYSPTDHFSVNLYLTFSGYNSSGYSLWFNTTADAAPHISLTGRTYGSVFTSYNPFVSFPLNFTLAEGNGYYTTPNVSDLGAIHGNVAPGTYFIGDVSIELSGLLPGTYLLQTDDFGGHASEVSECNEQGCVDNFLPTAAYTIVVIPEPSTFALLGLGLLGVLGIRMVRQRL